MHYFFLFSSNSTDKIIIVSQWTGCLGIIGRILVKNGLPHCVFTGDTSVQKRSGIVEVIFNVADKISILIS